MNKFVTILAFDQSYDAHLAKSRLEAEEIEVFLKDELSTQTQHHLSQAFGGIKLQVREKDLVKAVHILKNIGYNLEVNKPSVFWTWFNDFSKKIAFMKGFSLEARFIIFLTFIVVLIGVPLFFIASKI